MFGCIAGPVFATGFLDDFLSHQNSCKCGRGCGNCREDNVRTIHGGCGGVEIWNGEVETLSEGIATVSEVVNIYHFLRPLIG